MDEFRLGEPLVTGEVTVLPVERHYCHPCREGGAIWLSGGKEPVAVIVRDASGLRAFDMQAAERTVASLAEEMPGLAPALASLGRDPS